MTQGRLREVFSTVYNAFVFLDAHDKGVLDRATLQRQMTRLLPEISVDQIMMELLEGAEEDDEGEGIRPEVFLRHLAWHPLPSLRRAQREAVAEARRHKQQALTQYYNWQFRVQPATVGGRSMITLDDLALLPVSEIAVSMPTGALSARSSIASTGAYATWKGTLRKYSDSLHDGGAWAPRSRPCASSQDQCSPETPRGAASAGAASVATPRAWISDGQRDIAKTQLLREKRKLAVQLLEAQRKLVDAGVFLKSSSPSTLASPASGSRNRTHHNVPRSADPSGATRISVAQTGAPSQRHRATHPSFPVPEREHGVFIKEREHREFVGPKGPYREVTATDRLARLLKDDRCSSVEKCMTRMGLWMATPPSELRVGQGEQKASCFRESCSRESYERQPASAQQQRQKTRDLRSPRPNSKPKRISRKKLIMPSHDLLIDECLELVSGLMLPGSPERARQRARARAREKEKDGSTSMTSSKASSPIGHQSTEISSVSFKPSSAMNSAHGKWDLDHRDDENISAWHPPSSGPVNPYLHTYTHAKDSSRSASSASSSPDEDAHAITHDTKSAKMARVSQTASPFAQPHYPQYISTKELLSSAKEPLFSTQEPSFSPLALEDPPHKNFLLSSGSAWPPSNSSISFSLDGDTRASRAENPSDNGIRQEPTNAGRFGGEGDGHQRESAAIKARLEARRVPGSSSSDEAGTAETKNHRYPQKGPMNIQNSSKTGTTGLAGSIQNHGLHLSDCEKESEGRRAALASNEHDSEVRTKRIPLEHWTKRLFADSDSDHAD